MTVRRNRPLSLIFVILANIYIFVAGNLKTMAYFYEQLLLIKKIISALKLKTSVPGCTCGWPGWIWLQFEKFRLNRFKLFPLVFKNIDINDRGLFFFFFFFMN